MGMCKKLNGIAINLQGDGDVKENKWDGKKFKGDKDVQENKWDKKKLKGNK